MAASGIKTRENTSYSIEKWTDNIIEITTVNGYVTSNVVYYTSYNENAEAILKEFESKLL